jgi:hypothetical protein
MHWVYRVVHWAETLWTTRLSRTALALIVALALALRLALLPVPAFHHPDEVFQYLEPAHRLVTGYGVVTWEWREELRSWFVPLLLAGPMAVSEWWAPGTLAYLPIIRGLTALGSISVVLSFHSIGCRISRLHGLLAAFVAATWFELVYFSVHTLSEPMALALIMPAAALLWSAEKRSSRALIAAGFLLGLAVIVRYQYVVAIGVLVLFTCKLHVRQAWLFVAAGGLAALLLGAGVDLVFGAMPYRWLFNNLAANLFEGRAAMFGEHGPFFYLSQVVFRYWGASALLVIAFAVVAARHYPALFAAAVVNGLVHSLIGHKEYRFVLLSTAIIALFFALGVADALAYLRRKLSTRANTALTIATIGWLAALSFSLAVGKPFRHEWWHYSAPLRAMTAVNRLEPLCGVALFGSYFDTGGYTYLNRSAPIYLFERWGDAPALRAAAPAFDAIIAPREAAGLLPTGFTRDRCFVPAEAAMRDAPPLSGVCVFRRSGPCRPGPIEINGKIIDRERRQGVIDAR